MTTMTRWSPYMPRLHFHHHHDVNGLFPRFFDDAPDEAAQPAASWLPAAEGRLVQRGALSPLTLRPTIWQVLINSTCSTAWD